MGIVMALGMAATGMAQTTSTTTTAAAASNLTFQVTSQAVMAGIGGKYEAGTDAIGTLTLSPHWSVRSDNVVLPGPGIGLNTAGAEYSATIPKSEFSYNLNAGVGMVSSPAPMHFAANVGGTLSFSPSGEPKLSITIITAQYFHGAVADGATQTSNWWTIGTGLELNLSRIF